MTAMTADDINALNAVYAAEMESRDGDPAHIVTNDVAQAFGLEAVRCDDESGVLYRHVATGCYVYGWQSGGFDNQIGA